MSVLDSSASKRGLRAAADVASGRPRAPSPVRYAWGSWLCNFCSTRPRRPAVKLGPLAASGTGLRKYSKRYAEPVDLNTAPEWYRQEVAAQQRASAKQQKRRHTQSVLDAVLTRSGWHCARCRVWNFPDRQKCFRCSALRGDDCITRGMPRPADDRAESDDSSIGRHRPGRGSAQHSGKLGGSPTGPTTRWPEAWRKEAQEAPPQPAAALQERGKTRMPQESRAGHPVSAGVV